MHTVQIVDSTQFEKQARAVGHVQVTRFATASPIQGEAETVVLRSAMGVSYSIQFEDPNMGPTEWTYQEVVLADKRGEVSLMGLLYQRLDPATVEFLYRSGSF